MDRFLCPSSRNVFHGQKICVGKKKLSVCSEMGKKLKGSFENAECSVLGSL